MILPCQSPPDVLSPLISHPLDILTILLLPLIIGLVMVMRMVRGKRKHRGSATHEALANESIVFVDWCYNGLTLHTHVLMYIKPYSSISTYCMCTQRDYQHPTGI